MADILIVDDERDIRELIGDILRDEGYDTRLAASSDDCMSQIGEALPSLLLLDIWLKDSDMDGIDILKHVKREHPEVPIIIISGHGNIEIAVAAIKQGAYDFIEKPFNIDQLMVVIGRAMETSRLRRENATLKRAGGGDVDMIGVSTAFKQLKSNLEKVTKSNGRVLLSGPAGVGKEVAARFIHAGSDRKDAPFVIVSSATVEPDRMEEVLFGRESAERGIEKGLLEEASGGVIYFDEVADMPLGTQSKILRVLVDQKFNRVGGTGTVSVDLRVVSSPSRDLQAEIAAGNFREELYHRLNVVPIDVPPLEKRCEDIPELAGYFIERFNQEQGLPLRSLSEDAAATLQTMSWPGNVRQLESVLWNQVVMNYSPVIKLTDLPADFFDSPSLKSEADVSEAEAYDRLVGNSIANVERQLIERTIEAEGGSVTAAAKVLGVSPSTLYRKLEAWGSSTPRR